MGVVNNSHSKKNNPLLPPLLKGTDLIIYLEKHKFTTRGQTFETENLELF